MFESNEIYDDDFFKGHVEAERVVARGMELMLWLAAAVVTSILLAVICRCCCRSKSRGRVIAPPPRDESVPAAYPQQQYAPAPAVYTGPSITAYPVAAAPYPTVTPYPSHAPAPAPYPTHAPYPAGTPYPAGAPYPTAAPYPAAPAPTAPDASAFYGVAPPGWTPQACCPPSYDQAMSAEQHKQPPYNPHAPR